MAKSPNKKSPATKKTHAAIRKSRRIGLLRGVNVGGRNKIKMAELRDAMSGAGLADVSSYIQSGNLFFQSSLTDAAVETQLSQIIEKNFDCVVPVLVRSAKFFEKVIARNPMTDADVSKLHVTILDKKPSRKLVSAIDAKAHGDAKAFGDDTFEVVGDVVYVFCPNGYGKTKLTNGFFESKLKVRATTRNWKTLQKLVELATS